MTIVYIVVYECLLLLSTVHGVFGLHLARKRNFKISVGYYLN